MSADMMLVCKNREENFEKNSQKCVKIDETSMGSPWSDFGKMFAGQFAGFCEPIIDDEFIIKVRNWHEKLSHEQSEPLEKIIVFLEEHKGERLEYECW